MSKIKKEKEEANPMNKVFLVKGFTGEYEDSIDWVAKAFHTRTEAKQYLDQLLAIVRKYGPGNEGAFDYETQADFERELEEIDPKCRVDYTGVYYEIEEVQINH